MPVKTHLRRKEMSAKIDKRAKGKGPTTREKKESTRNKTQKPQKHLQLLKVKTCKLIFLPSKIYADTIKQGRLEIGGGLINS